MTDNRTHHACRPAQETAPACLPDRHHLRPQNQPRLGTSATRNELCQWHYLLVSFARLAGRRRLGQAASSTADPSLPSRAGRVARALGDSSAARAAMGGRNLAQPRQTAALTMRMAAVLARPADRLYGRCHDCINSDVYVFATNGGLQFTRRSLPWPWCVSACENIMQRHFVIRSKLMDMVSDPCFFNRIDKWALQFI